MFFINVTFTYEMHLERLVVYDFICSYSILIIYYYFIIYQDLFIKMALFEKVYKQAL